MSDWLTVSLRCEHRGQGVEADPATLLTFAFPAGQTGPKGFIPGGRVVLGDRVVPIGDSRMIRVILDVAGTGRLPRVVHELRCDVCPFSVRRTDTELQRRLRLAGHAGFAEVEVTSI